MTSEEDETFCEKCGYPEDSFACKIRHIQINTGDANSKRPRWDQAADRHNEHFS